MKVQIQAVGATATELADVVEVFGPECIVKLGRAGTYDVRPFGPVDTHWATIVADELKRRFPAP